jgi:multimeric flavodoxin WrbA
MQTKNKLKSVLILNGSPRANGNTAAAIKIFREALDKQSFTIKQHDLYKLNFKGCSHCDACKKIPDTHGCILKDDLIPILDDIIASNVIVIASPIYCWAVTGCMSGALDRWYSLFSKQGSSLINGKKVIGVFSSGGDAFDGMELCVTMLKNICEYGKAIYAGTLTAINSTIPGELLRRQELKTAAEVLVAEL